MSSTFESDRADLRCYFTWVHGENCGVDFLPLQLGRHMSKHHVQRPFGGAIGRKSGFVNYDLSASTGIPSNPSSCAWKSVAEPESLDIKVIVPMGMRVCNSFCAAMVGPIVFVFR